MNTLTCLGYAVQWWLYPMIKFFVNAVGQTAKRVSELLIQYEQLIMEDWEHLIDTGTQPKSIFLVYEYLKQCPIVSSPFAAKGIGLSFNLVSKALHILQELGIVVQTGDGKRNRIWIHRSLINNMNT